MGSRVVEGTGLENRQARKRLEGSNPSPSAIIVINYLFLLVLPRRRDGIPLSYPHCFYWRQPEGAKVVSKP
jgi:hypothetical protein